MDRALIIDGHAYAYRAFHAIRRLNSPDGRPTNAIFGFVKMLSKMRGSLNPSHLAVVWDGGLSAARMAALPDATRTLLRIGDEVVMSRARRALRCRLYQVLAIIWVTVRTFRRSRSTLHARDLSRVRLAHRR